MSVKRKLLTAIILITGQILTALMGILGSVASGQLPEEWKPYLWLSWPIFGVLLILTLLLFLIEKIIEALSVASNSDQPPIVAGTSKSGAVTSKKESNARKKYLEIIEADVTNRLKSSIHRARFIDIGSEQTLNSTSLPWQYQAYDTPKQFTSFDEAFESFERRILLLGAPGAGKTTTLLHIAQKLIQDAKHDPNAPIPLLFNLSKYRGDDETQSRSALPFFASRTPPFEQSKEQPIEEWLIELTSEYPSVSKEMARSWIEGKRVALLLDGLDEVHDQLLVNLVLKLNTYLDRDLDITMVLCSRIIDYQPLQQNQETRLHLNGAVTLQPLNQRQIDAYLEKAQAIALRDALPNDAALYELAQTPLTLSMMTLAYGGLTPTDIPSNLPLVERRRHLFDTYVDRMMQRKARRDAGIPFDLNPDHDQPTPYTREQINHYLGWLAVRLSERRQTVFPLHKLHSFLDQNREDEQDEGSWRATDIAYLVLAALSALLIGLFLMPKPKSLIGLGQAILISGAIALPSVAYRWLQVAFYNKLSEKIGKRFEYITIIGFFSIFAIYFGGIVMALATILPWDIAPIPLGAIMLVLLIAGRYLSDSTSKNHVLFVVITVISVLLPIGAMILSGQMNSPEVAIAVSMVVGQVLFLTILVSKNSLTDWLSSLFRVLMGIGRIALATIIGITLIATPDWYEVTALTGVAFAVVLLNEGPATIIASATLGAMLSSIVAGPSGAALGSLLLGLGGWYYLKGRNDSISEKYLVNPILRIILAIGGLIRLNYYAFLNYTVSTLLLKEVGSEYEFVHRLLRDHFATRELIPLLSEGHIEQTLQVIQQLSLQGESALDTLAGLTTDSDARIHQAAVVGFAKIATPEAVELMKKVLHHSDTRVRQAVVRNASKLTKHDAKKLFEIALHDEELNVRLAVVAAVDKFVFQNKKTIPHSSRGEFIPGYRSIDLISKNNSRVVVSGLLKPLRDSDKYMRRVAAETLGQIGDARAVSGLLAALGDSDHEVRRVAAEALGRIGNPTAVSGLLTALDDSDHGVRRVVPEALGQIGDSTAVSGLLVALGHSDDLVRRAAALALRQIGHATTGSELLTALRDRDNLVRWAAAEALGQIGDATTVSGLLTALRDRDYLVRNAAASALGRIGDATAVSGLLTALRDSDDRVRDAATLALVQIGDATAVAGLLTALRDNDNRMRSTAAEALGRIGDATAVPALIERLTDSSKIHSWKDERVCDAAAEALERIGTPEALQAVEQWRES